MDIQWRTIQMFLSANDGVNEVQVDAENPQKLRCDCPSFASSARCKHTKFIRARMAEADGHYNITIAGNVSDDEAYEAILDAEAFREFLIKYAKVEVID